MLIVGAGVSGLGAACHLRRDHPGRRIAILEARDTLGGTWDLFRYPGVRADTDMHTFGYAFAPWRARPGSPTARRSSLSAFPGGDLFAAVSRGTASVRTDTVATFTEDGLLLASGERLAADIIVTATGLNVEALGDVRVTVDDTPVNLADTVVYKGLLLSGVPNLAYLVGYTHASWTLRIGLAGEYLSRLLTHMDAHGHTTARPEVGDPPLATRRWPPAAGHPPLPGPGRRLPDAGYARATPPGRPRPVANIHRLSR
ncbi:NAD(P)-binding protein [Frankia sp. AgPm24]|uniref:NAD(P)-binding protein n=1 Tax=Frankia sp. AgPm24 TaxID=631128 RepID=UPI00200DF3C6|nr:NAD(P)-binding protein [Frankia sp. AgPm24]MCK9922048.1 NAD(P)-binding protein [Frankia sp. AgPm24]